MEQVVLFFSTESTLYPIQHFLSMISAMVLYFS
jgi:hypothetical protein